MSAKYLKLGATTFLVWLVSSCTTTQPQRPATQHDAAMQRLLYAIKTPPYYGLAWHDLKLAAIDQVSVAMLKSALQDSGREAAGANEQALWIDAAAGHPEYVLAYYDNNAKASPNDKSLSNAACWARAEHGFDLKNALRVCDAALAADRQSYTLTFKAMVELQLGADKEALRDFDASLVDPSFRSNSKSAEATFGRGIARLRLGDECGHSDIAFATTAKKDVAIIYADLNVNP